MIVYAVESNGELISLFSTKELARKHASLFDSATVDEYALDSCVNEEKLTVYAAEVTLQGDIKQQWSFSNVAVLGTQNRAIKWGRTAMAWSDISPAAALEAARGVLCH